MNKKREKRRIGGEGLEGGGWGEREREGGRERRREKTSLGEFQS